MHWKKTPPPKRFEERTIERFAWLPTIVSNGTIVVWLENYYVDQTYNVISPNGTTCFWLDINKRFIPLCKRDLGGMI